MNFIGSVSWSESLSDCVLAYKPLHDKAPGYPQELCVPVDTNTRRSTLQSASDDQLTVPRTNTKAGERAFSVAGPVHGTTYRVTLLDNRRLYHL